MSANGKPNSDDEGLDEAVAVQGPQEISVEEAEQVGDLGNDMDDPEGWMAERPDYWAQVAAEAPLRLNREAWLRHRLIQAWEALRHSGRGRAWIEIDTRTPDAEWIELYESEFGPVQRHEPPTRSRFYEAIPKLIPPSCAIRPVFERPIQRRVARTTKG